MLGLCGKGGRDKPRGLCFVWQASFFGCYSYARIFDPATQALSAQLYVNVTVTHGWI